MLIIINLLLSTIAVIISAYILPGVHVNGFLTAMIVAIILGIVNAVLKPLFVLFTLPLTIVTFGLFIFIINGLMVLIVSSIVPGFHVDGLLWAILFSIVLSLVSTVISSLEPQR